MIQIEFIIAFAMALLNLFKHKLTETATPIAAIFLAVVLNVLNAILFGGDVTTAGRDAFVTGGIFVGIFASGTYIRKAVAKEPAQITTTVITQDPLTPDTVTAVSKTETKEPTKLI
jgi:ABC-type uncharacterized transport system permease subunit